MLSDLEIKKLLKSGQLNIHHFDEKRLGPVSYDIHTDLEGWDGNMAKLVSTETFILPRTIAGIIFMRSGAIVRERIFASFSSLVDPGYNGKLVFLVYSPADYAFNWENLFQIMFFKVEGKVGVSYDERDSSTAMHRTGFEK